MPHHDLYHRLGQVPALLFCSLALGLFPPASALAQADRPVIASSDITFAPTASNTLIATDHATIRDDLMGQVLIQTINAIPASADLVGWASELGGNSLFVLDTAASLPGDVVARSGDVIRLDGVDFSIAFDATASGVPAAARVDAVSSLPSGLLLSFDTTVALPGGLTVADEDLVGWDGVAYSMLLDGSAAGIDSRLDIDAAHALGGGYYAVSFDTDGIVGSVAFSDHDIVRWDGTSWSLQLATTSLDLDWAPADLDALMVPEPRLSGSIVLMMIAWIAILARMNGYLVKGKIDPGIPS
ncbi:MAG: hypothetical protein AB8G23_01575 [Myxococcota bacterium]